MPIRFKFLRAIVKLLHESMSMFRIDIFVAPSETVSLWLVRQIIINKDSPIGQRSHFKITPLLYRLILGIFEITCCQHWPTMETNMQWITVWHIFSIWIRWTTPKSHGAMSEFYISKNHQTWDYLYLSNWISKIQR